ncbi:hypothetical protein [Nonomuraea basaltis]|uniref:hypothetical protein n=1 Tax=Nonomuraea basaltis TaxID=2495887 RepID=UPI00110C63CE|nr:hypothetical protein [Nonomuraea basaltis]TMS00143.1 hypothetical protein EJK15_03465 [Nonomuraea basaltis]
MTMTATRSSLTGHTLTVERILDVPELEGTRLRERAESNTFDAPVWVFVERRDGAFVCDHGTNDRRDLNPNNHVWDNARFLAERLSGRAGEHEDLRYVGPGRDGDWQAAYVREGWHVRLTPRGEWLRVVEVVQHVNLATLRRTGQVRYRTVTLVLEDGRTVVRKNAAYLTARPTCR